MRVQTTAKLCAASAVAGVVLIPPTARKAREKTRAALKRGARRYVAARNRIRSAADTPGQRGHLAAKLARNARHGVAGGIGRWKGLVAEVEQERNGVHAAQPGPMLTVEKTTASHN